MPLPDERPRQSVANLIGRFENQTKHLSPSQHNASRSSSVISQATGDSANLKDETKERREWPPKVEKSTSSPNRFIPSTIANQTETKTEEGSEYQQGHNEPNTFLENWRKDLPRVTETEPELPTCKPVDDTPIPTPPAPAVQQVVSAPSTPRILSTKTAPRMPPSSSSKSVGASAKAQGKSFVKPRQSLTPATSAQALKPQLTGQSIVSSSSKKSISKSPISYKSPPRRESGTKTPTLTPRSKTPSSGLFAPTMASLAKARSTPLPALPVKKSLLSTEAMERLSKPTAASLSRVKSGPNTIASTPKSPPRISSIKTKPTTSPTQTKIKKEGVTTPAVVKSSVPTPTVAAEVIPEPIAVVVADEHPSVEAPVEETLVNPEVNLEPMLTNDVVEVVVNNEDAIPTDESIKVNGNDAHVEETVEAKTNLEDIVSLLETGPTPKPLYEDILEIPDEDGIIT